MLFLKLTSVEGRGTAVDLSHLGRLYPHPTAHLQDRARKVKNVLVYGGGGRVRVDMCLWNVDKNWPAQT